MERAHHSGAKIGPALVKFAAYQQREAEVGALYHCTVA
jgi:hypothetical protein